MDPRRLNPDSGCRILDGGGAMRGTSSVPQPLTQSPIVCYNAGSLKKSCFLQILRDHEGRDVRLTGERLAHTVVVKVMERDAFVVTAYLTDKPKAGRLIWSRER